MRIVPVEHHRVESLRANDSAQHVWRTRFHVAAGVDDLFGPQIGSPVDIGTLLRAAVVAAVITAATDNGGGGQAAPGQGSTAQQPPAANPPSPEPVPVSRLLHLQTPFRGDPLNPERTVPFLTIPFPC